METRQFHRLASRLRFAHDFYVLFVLQQDSESFADNLVIERNQHGKPHKGKVLAAVVAHPDETTLFCAGTVAKLIDEGLTWYLIRLSNDEKAGRTVGYGVVQNEIDNREAAKALGCKKEFSFYYRNHRMDDCAAIQIRQRLIFMFRLLQVNTVFLMDPYVHNDENPDHLVVGRQVEAACWKAGTGGGRGGARCSAETPAR